MGSSLYWMDCLSLKAICEVAYEVIKIQLLPYLFVQCRLYDSQFINGCSSHGSP